MTKNTSFKFSDVITRLPANSVVDGLREGDGVNPNADVFSTQHANYLDVLRSINVATTVLPPLEQYPDSVFVEDAALVIGDTAILLHPGAPSRTGEAIEIKPVLAKHFRQVIELPQASGSSAAYVDGGDILIAETEVFAGLSARTNAEGIQSLTGVLKRLGYSVRLVETPTSILHFKTACGLLDAETIFATQDLVNTGCFEGYRVITAIEGEEGAANLIRVNDYVLIAVGYPKTRIKLENAGYKVLEVDISEAAKVDGGLSCMSLRFNRSYSPGSIGS